MKKTNGDEDLLLGRFPVDNDRVRTWKLVDEMALRAFALANRLPQEEKDGLSRQIKRAAALCGASVAEWASRNKTDSDRSILRQSHSLMMHLRYYIYLARRLNLIEQKEYFLIIRKHEAASKNIEDLLVDHKS
jgi:four helix bundle protein